MPAGTSSSRMGRAWMDIAGRSEAAAAARSGAHGQVVRDDAVERQPGPHQLQRRGPCRRAARRWPPGAARAPPRPRRARSRSARASSAAWAAETAGSSGTARWDHSPSTATPGTAASAARPRDRSDRAAPPCASGRSRPPGGRHTGAGPTAGDGQPAQPVGQLHAPPPPPRPGSARPARPARRRPRPAAGRAAGWAPRCRPRGPPAPRPPSPRTASRRRRPRNARAAGTRPWPYASALITAAMRAAGSGEAASTRRLWANAAVSTETQARRSTCGRTAAASSASTARSGATGALLDHVVEVGAPQREPERTPLRRLSLGQPGEVPADTRQLRQQIAGQQAGVAQPLPHVLRRRWHGGGRPGAPRPTGPGPAPARTRSCRPGHRRCRRCPAQGSGHPPSPRRHPALATGSAPP